ncbi:MAG: helix-turn-helix domain-containing protein [Blastocatellia bacterium]|nr:helix-turn-helix domain-containing protein [Blastocatellia bacterium]
MSSQPIEDYQPDGPPIEEIATEVALILTRRLSAKDIVRLLQIVFLEVDEAAELLRVEPKTIRAWVSQEKIPYRKANGRVIFMLAELLQWTLPENDRHSQHRLAASTACNIAARKLAATCGKE